MSCFTSKLGVLPFLLIGALWVGGCLPSSHSQLDEEKEYHYLAGKSRITSMDFKGAIQSFERALEANPQSSAAHFELGWLYDQKESDPAAAVYHYSRYLRFRPGADNADMVKTRILACKQELASTISLGPVTQTLQRELQALAEENARLKSQVGQLQAAYAALAQAQQTAPASSSAPGATAVPAQPFVQSPGGSSRTTPQTTPVMVMTRPTAVTTPTASARATRTHTVQSGDTLTSIARKYSVKITDLTSANPRVDPRRMKIGDKLTIP